MNCSPDAVEGVVTTVADATERVEASVSAEDTGTVGTVGSVSTVDLNVAELSATETTVVTVGFTVATECGTEVSMS